MKRITLSLIFVFLLILVIGCQKEPKHDYILNLTIERYNNFEEMYPEYKDKMLGKWKGDVANQVFMRLTEKEAEKFKNNKGIIYIGIYKIEPH